MSMNEETARAGIRVREAEKAHNIRTFSHGRGAKKKGPNCIQIRVLLWQITLILIQMHLRTSWGAFGFLGCISFIRLHSGCSADAGDASFLFLSLLYRMLAASEQSGSRNIAAPGTKLKVIPFSLAPAAPIPQ